MKVIGLMSGTSMDGVDAALLEVGGTTPQDFTWKLLGFEPFPYGPERRSEVKDAIDAGTAAKLCRLHAELGEWFAEAALGVCRATGTPAESVDVIGSHGQTVWHEPPVDGRRGATLQLTDAATIAERTGIPVVSDFRTRDMAAGGQGAPLVPYFDWAVFRKPGVVRAFQNIGGIANVSVVGDRLDDVLAFDTGPGNMILDGLARRMTGGRLQCDLDGQLSRQGTIIPSLLEELLAHPFFTLPPPRSAGREGFGEALVSFLWDQASGRPEDLMTTALAFTVEATAHAYEAYVFPRFNPLEAVYVSGGGSRNPMLMGRFRARMGGLPVRTLDELGFPEGAKEAACFALLAAEHLVGTPANVPSATGARRRVVLGKLTP